ncbi:MAG: sodium/hydrogen exchanger [Candidatus Berkelbacteria bacterium Licking1014_85]|uniref:Sodium/hydrogen exchanger n=1 Tax=Candidatus Berkelbacteria bacterium Licking1014_85 TaxID=2017148 RepID=A0A554LII9_9BACT|nr:MAG: sodium/hydrogen exchanger [Candidatus Berkelbacteria bacterium Licking1014_85]
MMFLQGFKKRTGFLVSVSLAQMSEFSLIIGAVGLSFNHINQELSTIIVLVCATTIIISTYLMEGSDFIFSKIRKMYRFVDRFNHFQDDKFTLDEKLKNHIIVFGAGHVVDRVLNIMKSHELDFVVVDFDPTVIQRLKEKKIKAIYGDMGDPEIIEKLNIDDAKIVISTTHEIQDDLRILKELNVVNKKCFSYMTAFTPNDALKLYEFGADFVILPNQISWDVLGEMIKEIKSDNYAKIKNSIELKKKKHIENLGKLV